MTATQFYADDISPRQQAFAIIKDFIAGKPFPGPRMFKRMRPGSDDVWEMRTADLRFFGWFAAKDCFVAVAGDFFETLKEDKSRYEAHRLDVLAKRIAIDLDEPKYLKGAKENDVVSG
ncbi:hypothetical protein [Rhizobium sp. NXC24]|uniref:hypothetical protein n=1 Tax=Rhizobium sp. NXC24 TaxID=2048897 RepID=UPI00131A5DB8|nr:hypothetical protein [Rhizobium sp. NXC24]